MKLWVICRVSKRNPKILLEDILSSVNKILEYTKDLKFTEFEQTPMIIDAVARNIEIIGEAAARTPEDIQNKFVNIPWVQLKGIRNRIVHEYFNVDCTIIWYIVENELSSLKDNIKNALKDLGHDKI